MSLHKNTKVFTKHYDSYLKKDPHVFSQILNYKTCLYNFVSLHKKYQSVYKTLRFISEKKILMCSHKYLTIKTCLYNFMSLHKKNTKDPPVFFHKTLRFISEKKILMCSHKYLTIKPVYTTLCLYIKNTKVFTKHYDSYPSVTIKPVYTTLCLYTKNTKDPPVFFHIYTKIPKILLCFFPQNSTIHIRVTIKPVYTTLCLYTKIPKILLCFSTKHYDSYPKNILMCSIINPSK